MRAAGGVVLADLMTDEDRAQLGENTLLSVRIYLILLSVTLALMAHITTWVEIGLARTNREGAPREISLLLRRSTELFHRWRRQSTSWTSKGMEYDRGWLDLPSRAGEIAN